MRYYVISFLVFFFSVRGTHEYKAHCFRKSLIGCTHSAHSTQSAQGCFCLLNLRWFDNMIWVHVVVPPYFPQWVFQPHSVGSYLCSAMRCFIRVSGSTLRTEVWYFTSESGQQYCCSMELCKWNRYQWQYACKHAEMEASLIHGGMYNSSLDVQ